MQKKPKYMTPGSRSASEGSGVTGGIPKMREGAGELTPPWLVSKPGGSPSVEYYNGAEFTASGGSRAEVRMVPLSED